MQDQKNLSQVPSRQICLGEMWPQGL